MSEEEGTITPEVRIRQLEERLTEETDSLEKGVTSRRLKLELL